MKLWQIPQFGEWLIFTKIHLLPWQSKDIQVCMFKSSNLCFFISAYLAPFTSISLHDSKRMTSAHTIQLCSTWKAAGPLSSEWLVLCRLPAAVFLVLMNIDLFSFYWHVFRVETRQLQSFFTLPEQMWPEVFIKKNNVKELNPLSDVIRCIQTVTDSGELMLIITTIIKILLKYSWSCTLCPHSHNCREDTACSKQNDEKKSLQHLQFSKDVNAA